MLTATIQGNQNTSKYDQNRNNVQVQKNNEYQLPDSTHAVQLAIELLSHSLYHISESITAQSKDATTIPVKNIKLWRK